MAIITEASAGGHRRVVFGRRRLVPLALLSLLVAALAVAWLSRREPAAPAADLLMSTTADGQQFVALDPATLVDRPAGSALEPGTPYGWALSGDGSTLVSIVAADTSGRLLAAEDITVIVRDGRTGAERTRFRPPGRVVFPRLSDDGSRLVVERRVEPPTTILPEWYVLSTADGRVLATVKSDAPEGWSAVIDATARRLVRIVTQPYTAEMTGPAPVRLIVHDLMTGAETGRMTVPGVLAGWWPSERKVGDDPVTAYLNPGVAFTPDGRRLALVHADALAVTLVDVERLAVERQIALSRPAGWLDWLPLAPQIAAAKAAEGTERQAVFAPDGRYLYIFGLTSWVDAQGEPAYRGLGLALADLERGQLVAESLADERISTLLPTPDGRSVYAYGPQRDGKVIDAGTPHRLRRLDATTLAVLTERETVGNRFLLLRPYP